MKKSGRLFYALAYGAACGALAGCGIAEIPSLKQGATAPSEQSTLQSAPTGNSTFGKAKLPDAGSEEGYVPIPGIDGNTDGGIIQTFKPVLAVRATGCIMCHARVASAMVTDFGYGDDYYFGAGFTGGTPFNGAIYGDHQTNWATASLWGSVVVPNTVTPLGSSIRAYLTGKLAAPDAVTPPPTVYNAHHIYIGAPDAATLRQIGAGFPNAHGSWRYQPSVSGDVSGLVTAPSGTYIRNSDTEPLVCDGELFVDGVLFLKNLKVSTTNGCHIYATASVFIQGPITYLNNPPNANLQISSSRAIMLGMGPGPVVSPGNGTIANTIQYRLEQHWCAPGMFTRASPDSAAPTNKAIIADSLLIADLQDAGVTADGRNVSMSHLLLNAPHVHSRYLGAFNGVIIAEIALGSLSNFNFQFDEVFSHVPLLPSLQPSEYLTVTP